MPTNIKNIHLPSYKEDLKENFDYLRTGVGISVRYSMILQVRRKLSNPYKLFVIFFFTGNIFFYCSQYLVKKLH